MRKIAITDLILFNENREILKSYSPSKMKISQQSASDKTSLHWTMIWQWKRCHFYFRISSHSATQLSVLRSFAHALNATTTVERTRPILSFVLLHLSYESTAKPFKLLLLFLFLCHFFTLVTAVNPGFYGNAAVPKEERCCDNREQPSKSKRSKADECCAMKKAGQEGAWL